VNIIDSKTAGAIIHHCQHHNRVKHMVPDSAMEMEIALITGKPITLRRLMELQDGRCSRIMELVRLAEKGGGE